jgi:hypothetical protein
MHKNNRIKVYCTHSEPSATFSMNHMLLVMLDSNRTDYRQHCFDPVIYFLDPIMQNCEID